MDVALAFQSLWRRKLLVVLAALVSAAAGILLTYRVSLSPFELQNRGVEYAVGQASILVDAGESPLGDATASVQPLIQRAQIINASLAGTEMRTLIARRAGIPQQDLAVGSLGAGGGRDPAADQRAAQIVDRGQPYQVTFRPTANSPVILVATQAPTVAEASSLAGDVVQVSARYVEDQVLRSPSRSDRVVLRSLEAPSAGLVNPSGAVEAAVVVAVGIFLALLFLILLVTRIRTDLAARSGTRDVAPVS